MNTFHTCFATEIPEHRIQNKTSHRQNHQTNHRGFTPQMHQASNPLPTWFCSLLTILLFEVEISFDVFVQVNQNDQMKQTLLTSQACFNQKSCNTTEIDRSKWKNTPNLTYVFIAPLPGKSACAKTSLLLVYDRRNYYKFIKTPNVCILHDQLVTAILTNFVLIYQNTDSYDLLQLSFLH